MLWDPTGMLDSGGDPKKDMGNGKMPDDRFLEGTPQDVLTRDYKDKYAPLILSKNIPNVIPSSVPGPLKSMPIALGDEDSKSENYKKAWLESIKDHFILESNVSLSYGVQTSIVPTPQGLQPLPYIRGGFGGFLNLGSLIIYEYNYNHNNDATHHLFGKGRMRVNQGFGLALGSFGSYEYTNKMTQMGDSEGVANISFFGGLLSTEFNFNTGDLDIGAMPSIRWAMGIGVSASAKAGIRLNLKN